MMRLLSVILVCGLANGAMAQKMVQAPMATPAPTPAPAPTAAAAPEGPRPVGFTWGNDVPALVDRGVEALGAGEFQRAEEDFFDARLRRPSEAVPHFNLGISAALQQEYDQARKYFDRAFDLAGDRPDLQAKAKYNQGVSHFMEARQAAGSGQTAEGIRNALSAIERFRQAEEIDPTNSAAKRARIAASDFLRNVAMITPTPTPPPQPQSGQDQEEQEQQDEQEQQQQPPPQQGEGEEEQQKEDEKEQQGQPQATPTPKPQGEGKGQSQGATPTPTPAGMTPREQAEKLLEQLGDEQNLVLRKPKDPTVAPEPEKPW